MARPERCDAHLPLEEATRRCFEEMISKRHPKPARSDRDRLAGDLQQPMWDSIPPELQKLQELNIEQQESRFTIPSLIRLLLFVKATAIDDLSFNWSLRLKATPLAFSYFGLSCLFHDETLVRRSLSVKGTRLPLTFPKKREWCEAAEEYVETDCYSGLHCIDKQHYTTGSGFIKTEKPEGSNLNLKAVPAFSSPASCYCNPATNDWIPQAETVIPVSQKPGRSES